MARDQPVACEPAEAYGSDADAPTRGPLASRTRWSRSVSGPNGSAIGTLVERSTRYTLLVHLPHGHSPGAVQAALLEAVKDVPPSLKRSLTWDQGAEMAHHYAFSKASGVPVYFCDPHSPWQRGSNENTNGLLR